MALALLAALVLLVKGRQGRPAIKSDEERAYFVLLNTMLSFPSVRSLALATKSGCDAVEVIYDAFLEDWLVS